MVRETERKWRTRTTLLIGLGRKNYNFWQGIAELIDNALAKDATVIDISINETTVKIRDNGTGQDENGLFNAMNLGDYNPDAKSESTYGMGIKQLWSWIGKEISILTKKVGEKEVHELSENLDKIMSKWEFLDDVKLKVKSHPLGEIEHCQSDEHFWILEYSKLNQRNLIVDDKVRTQLSRTFSNYMRSGIGICINGENLRACPLPKVIELPSYGTKRVKFENKEDGYLGWWAITVKNQKGRLANYGMRTYHNGRMITEADTEIFGVGDIIQRHPRFYRFTGEIHFNTPSIFDNKKLSSKNGWLRDRSYEKVQNWLNEKVRKPFDKELLIVTTKENKEKQTKVGDAIGKTASPHLKKAFPEVVQKRKEYERKKESDKDQEGEIDKECNVREKRKDGTKEEQIKEIDSTGYNDKQRPKQIHKKKRRHIPIYIGDKPYDLFFIHTTQPSSKDNRYDYYLNEEERSITVYINESRLDVKMLDANQRAPLFMEWVIEIIIDILKKGEISKSEFISEREDRLSKVNVISWLNDVKELIEETEED